MVGCSRTFFLWHNRAQFPAMLCWTVIKCYKIFFDNCFHRYRRGKHEINFKIFLGDLAKGREHFLFLPYLYHEKRSREWVSKHHNDCKSMHHFICDISLAMFHFWNISSLRDCHMALPLKWCHHSLNGHYKRLLKYFASTKVPHPQGFHPLASQYTYTLTNHSSS